MLGLLVTVGSARFESPTLNAILDWGRSSLKADIQALFEQCYPNSANTTIFVSGNGTYVITGDIEAMWLRDSCNQVMPYIEFPGPAQDPALQAMVQGLISSQARLVTLDPYANAYLNQTKKKAFQDRSTRLLFNRPL
jgi:meiotically up-regulated gene 157 (Mug157) protein